MDTAATAHLFELSLQHHRANRLKEAQAACQQIIALDPGHADAMQLLGIVTHQLRQGSDEAIALVKRAIALDPRVPEYHCNLGLIFSDLRAGRKRSARFGLPWNCGRNTPPRAITLAMRCGNRDGWKSSRLRRIAMARSRPRQTTSLAFSNLGNVLRELNRLVEAADAYRRAISLNPKFAAAHNNLANALNKQDRLDEAIAEYRHALQLLEPPQYAEARNNLGNALKDMGRLDEAIATYRQALMQNPNLPECQSNLLYDLHYRADFDPLAALEEGRAWERQHAASLSSQIRPHCNSRDPVRRLVIGYVSPDFRQHAVSIFLLPFLQCHDHAQVSDYLLFQPVLRARIM